MPFTIICKTCGKESPSIRRPGSVKASLYCSPACYRSRPDRPRRKYYHHVCENCQTGFDTDRENGRFCSLRCLGEYRRKDQPRTCLRCGKLFYLQPSHRGEFCSWECYSADRTPPIQICPICGKEFQVDQYFHNEVYCSRECYFRRPRIGTYKPCRHCGKPFYVIPAHAHNTYYCSRKCRVSHKGPSSIERLLQEELDRRNLHYENQYKVGRWSIDIAFLSQRLAIEADGDYWHSLSENQERDKRKNKAMQAHGWRVLRFTETEIHASVVNCVDQIFSHLTVSS